MMSAAAVPVVKGWCQDFFRQLLMNVLRASPVSDLVLASVLQSAMRCCELVRGLPSLVVLSPLKQVFMKVLRASPCRLLVLASALQVVMRFC